MNKKLPDLLNYQADSISTVSSADINYQGEKPKRLKQISMTKKAYYELHPNYRCIFFAADKSHRVRIACIPPCSGNFEVFTVFLSDSKSHPAP